jgi:hypothetical protein
MMEEIMRRLYLLLAVAGFVLPYYFLVAFLLSYGPNLGMLIEKLFASQISTFFATDLIITAVVFLIFSNAESKRLGIGNWWVFLLSTLVIGPSFSLPLFLYLREGRIWTGPGVRETHAFGDAS